VFVCTRVLLHSKCVCAVLNLSLCHYVVWLQIKHVFVPWPARGGQEQVLSATVTMDEHDGGGKPEGGGGENHARTIWGLGGGVGCFLFGAFRTPLFPRFLIESL